MYFMKKILIFISLFIAVFFISGCFFGLNSNNEVSGSDWTSVASVGSRAKKLDFIFNNKTLGKTTITIKRSEWNQLCENYRVFYKNENCVHAESYVYEKDGKSWTMNNVGFRLRGNTSRFCPQGYDNGNLQGQMNAVWSHAYYAYSNYQPCEGGDYRQSHFKVDFEEFLEDDEDQKMEGCLKGMALKRLDHSCGREIFCYDLFRRNGIWTAPRASHTILLLKIIEDESDNSITKVNYGVYEMFEEVNKQSLKARDEDEIDAANAWKNAKGNLWKCSYDLTSNPDWAIGVERIVIASKDDPEAEAATYTDGSPVLDKNGNQVYRVWKQYSLDLKTNKSDFDSAKSELKAFIAELNALPNPSGDSDYSSIATIKTFYEKWFDVDFFLRTYAINILCGMDDDYWGNANNYYLYFDTGSAKATNKVFFIPFDYDNTLGCSIHAGGFKNNPLNWGLGNNRPLMDKLLSVPEYKSKFIKYLKEASAEDSDWNFQRCSQQFLTWENMVSPYLYSSDLSYNGLGVSRFGDYTWQPEGYSLTSKGNNIFDASRQSFIRWFSGETLKIEEYEDSDYEGIKIKIKNIPSDAAIRKIYINGKQVSSSGFNWNSDGSYSIDKHVFESEWGYPYTKAGERYEVYIIYQNSSYANIDSSPKISITAKGGQGELYLANEPVYTIEDKILKFTPEPEIKIGNSLVKSRWDWDKYFILELETTDWQYQSWNWLGDSCKEFDFTKDGVVKNPFADFMFSLYYVISNEEFGNYQLYLYDYEDTKSFRL
ncbi:MAG: CotH kinase family protein [Treponema sp.]|nr:CotH kinase family protein [Treponema sp.]